MWPGHSVVYCIMMMVVSSALYHGVLTWLPPESHLKSTILAGASCENLLLNDFLINIQIVPIVMICDQIHNRMLFCKGQLLTMCLGPGNFQCQNISSALPSLQRWTVPWSREFQSKISIVGQKIFVWNNHAMNYLTRRHPHFWKASCMGAVTRKSFPTCHNTYLY